MNDFFINAYEYLVNRIEHSLKDIDHETGDTMELKSYSVQ